MIRCHAHSGASSDTEFGINGLIWEFGTTSGSTGPSELKLLFQDG